MKAFYFIIALLVLSAHCFCQVTDTISNISRSLLSDSVSQSLPPAHAPDTTIKKSTRHPYKVNYWLTGSIIVAGNVGNVFAINRIKNKPTITDAEIAALNTSYLTGLDRWALKQDPSNWEHFDRMSDDVITTTILLPGLLAFDHNIRHDWVNLLLMYAEAHAVVATIYNYSFLGPTFQNKFRPIVYYDSIALGTRENGNNRNSFYGGHVATATVATFMMTKIYCDFHPNIGVKKFLLYTAATLPPLAISYLRVKALKHFPSDNLAGMAIGAFFGVALPQLHKPTRDRTSFSMFTTDDGGVGLSLRWNVGGKGSSRDN